jgi:hypothetical protein
MMMLVGVMDAFSICFGVQGNTTLSHLDVQDNENIGDAGVAELASALKVCAAVPA